MNKYHFSISIHFKSDYDVEKLGEILKIQPTKITPLEKSLGEEKSAKFYYQTGEMTDIYTDNMFEDFVAQIAPNLAPLPQILKENNGTCVFRILFDEMSEKPCISLDNKTLGILHNLDASYEVDFIV